MILTMKIQLASGAARTIKAVKIGSQNGELIPTGTIINYK